MQNKTVLVTGANSGMGLATTVALAKLGANVIMLCRSRQRGEQALAEARRQSGSELIELMLCDLASLASIRAFAAAFLVRHDVLDVLVNNAGVVTVKRQTTADGFEAMMGVNHLGHFLLTQLLLDAIIRAPQGRIVNVSSGAHKIGRIDWANPHLQRGFRVWNGYAQSSWRISCSPASSRSGSQALRPRPTRSIREPWPRTSVSIATPDLGRPCMR